MTRPTSLPRFEVAKIKRRFRPDGRVTVEIDLTGIACVELMDVADGSRHLIHIASMETVDANELQRLRTGREATVLEIRLVVLPEWGRTLYRLVKSQWRIAAADPRYVVVVHRAEEASRTIVWWTVADRPRPGGGE